MEKEQGQSAGEPVLRGRTFVIAFAALFVVAVIGTTLARYALESEVGLNQAGIGLAKVHLAAVVWAEGHDGAYPEHIALLRANNYFRAKLLRDPRQPEGTVWHVGEFDARPFLEEIIQHDTQPQLDRAPLLDAVAGDPARDEPYYRFGDYFFVRLDRPRDRPDLVFGWTLPDEQSRRFVVFDNDETRRVHRIEWAEIWRADAAARNESGLPAMLEPPWPD